MVCQRYTRTMVDAEDILQEGFIKVFGHIGSFKGAAKLETWMTRIFINSASIISGKNCTCFLWMQKQQWSPPTTEHGGRMFNSMIGYRISTGNIRLYAAAGYKFQSVRSRYDFSNDQSGRYFYGLT